MNKALLFRYEKGDMIESRLVAMPANYHWHDISQLIRRAYGREWTLVKLYKGIKK